MENHTELAKAAHKGQRMRNILNDETFNQVVLDVTTKLKDQAFNTMPSQRQEREEAYLVHQGLRELITALDQIVADGELAELELATNYDDFETDI